MIIFVVVLIVFGPKKMPELARMIGRSLGEFRRATNDLKAAIDFEGLQDPNPQRPVPPASVPAEPKSEDEPVKLIPEIASPAYTDDEIEMPDPADDLPDSASVPEPIPASSDTGTGLPEEDKNAGIG